MKKGLIYCLICPKSKQPRYIGQTTRTLDIWGVVTAKKRKSSGGFKWIWSDELIKRI
jgi:hypothetical protein